LTQRDYRGKCHSREEEILNCSCIALNADYEEKGSKEESFTLAATWNSAQPAACPASDLQVLGLPPSRATSCLAPQLRGGGRESPTENPAATESAKNLKNLGKKM
jgi:hypothetical protein